MSSVVLISVTNTPQQQPWPVNQSKSYMLHRLTILSQLLCSLAKRLVTDEPLYVGTTHCCYVSFRPHVTLGPDSCSNASEIQTPSSGFLASHSLSGDDVQR